MRGPLTSARARRVWARPVWGRPVWGLHPLDQLAESLRSIDVPRRLWSALLDLDLPGRSLDAVGRSRRAGRGVGALGQLAALVLAGALVVAAAGSVALTVVADEIPEVDLALDEVPDLTELTDRRTSLPSVVLASDGSVLGRFDPPTLHAPVEPDSLPPDVVAAVVAAEDAEFFRHAGVDWSAVGRAVMRNVEEGDVDQGGSTITQQLVKNVFTDGDRSAGRKLREMVVAHQIERAHGKREILAAYLNTVFFGEHALGIGAAAHTYFGKAPADLTLSEAALLAAIIPAPTVLNPRKNPEGAEARRLEVLERVAEAGLATPAEVRVARQETPRLRAPTRGQAMSHPYYMDYVRRFLVDGNGLSPHEVFGGGLRIETTINPALQAKAEQAVLDHLPDPAGPSAAVVVIDNRTGHVKALVGGRSWETSKVNLALGSAGGGTGRQPGSSFKPFVLAAAMEDGLSLQDRIPAPAEYVPDVDDAEAARNYSERGYGEVTIADATIRSINTAYLGLTEKVGAPRVAELASALGISSLPDPGVVGPSLGIGAYEASPLQMAAAYAAFARDGHRLSASPVARITDARGEVIEERRGPHSGPRVISAESARLVTSALERVIQSGTGTAAGFGRPAAGKTGTSDAYENAWFVGYTPQFTTAVWVGHPEGNIPMHDVAGVANVTGGSLPAAIWRDVMAAAHWNTPALSFPPAPEQASTTTAEASGSVGRSPEPGADDDDDVPPGHRKKPGGGD